ncbi:MAG: hypothetical protein QOF53_3920 [Nocardioidaceae bacterium]|nr:hypothetical protein [Nocardioidaceae bacterium]
MTQLTAATAAEPRLPRRTTGRDEVLPSLVGVTVALLPILVPAGPGNTALADAGIAGCILLAAMWVSRERLPVTFPYAAGVVFLMIGGALGSTVAGAPLSTALVLAQDGFLLLWAAVLTLGRYDPAIIAAATVSWCRVAVVYSGFGVIAYIIGFAPMSGVSAKDGVRASYTFGDPNLAGNYLVTSLFVMMACRRPRATSTRRLGYLLVVVAMGFTGSNGAMLTFLMGLATCVAATRYRNRGALAGLMSLTVSTALVAVMTVFVLPHVDFDAIRADAANSIPLLRDSFGRSADSTSERATILGEGRTLYLQGNAVGYGPARTKATFQATQAPYVKEAHNDYLAALLERGVLGAFGLVLLIAAVGARCRRLLTGNLRGPLAEIVPRFWILVVVAPVMAVAGGFYEVLHFRHLWTWMGIVAALVMAMEQQSRQRDEEAP